MNSDGAIRVSHLKLLNATWQHSVSLQDILPGVLKKEIQVNIDHCLEM
jgi:hypothetical protein